MSTSDDSDDGFCTLDDATERLPGAVLPPLSSVVRRAVPRSSARRAVPAEDVSDATEFLPGNTTAFQTSNTARAAEVLSDNTARAAEFRPSATARGPDTSALVVDRRAYETLVERRDTTLAVQRVRDAWPPWMTPIGDRDARALAHWESVELSNELELLRNTRYRFAKQVAGLLNMRVELLVRAHKLVPHDTPPPPAHGGLRPFDYGTPRGNAGVAPVRRPAQPVPVDATPSSRPSNVPPRQPNFGGPPRAPSAPPPRMGGEPRIETAFDSDDDDNFARSNAFASAPQQRVDITALRAEVEELELLARRETLLAHEQNAVARAAPLVNRTSVTGVLFFSDLLMSNVAASVRDVHKTYRALNDVSGAELMGANDDVRAEFAELVASHIPVAGYMGGRQQTRAGDYTGAFRDRKLAALRQFGFVERVRHSGPLPQRLRFDTLALERARHSSRRRAPPRAAPIGAKRMCFRAVVPGLDVDELL